MYNPATQVQVSTDANLGSYFQKNKIAVGASPTAFPFKKKQATITMPRTAVTGNLVQLNMPRRMPPPPH
jgi:hypothetical protein